MPTDTTHTPGRCVTLTVNHKVIQTRYRQDNPTRTGQEVNLADILDSFLSELLDMDRLDMDDHGGHEQMLDNVTWSPVAGQGKWKINPDDWYEGDGKWDVTAAVGRVVVGATVCGLIVMVHHTKGVGLEISFA